MSAATTACADCRLLLGLACPSSTPLFLSFPKNASYSRPRFAPDHTAPCSLPNSPARRRRRPSSQASNRILRRHLPSSPFRQDSAMKITALLVLKSPGDSSSSSSGGGEQQQAVVLANASDVSHFGYFQRPAAREFILFVARTVALRTPAGRRQSVQHEEYKVHCYNQNGLCAIAFTDDHYPVRSAFSLLNMVLEEYQKTFGESWRAAKADATQPWQYLNDALTKYQDPAEADKLLKIQRDLDETKIILHKTIDSVLDRGERLDSLVEKSSDLSAASQMFYKQAKKTNSCCTIL